MVFRRLLACLLALSAAGACKKHDPPPEPAKEAVAVAAKADQDEAAAPLSVCDPRGKDPLEAARDYYEADKYEAALSCAAESCARAPDDAAAHAERASALAALKRYDEAKLAFARALALNPDLPDALLGAAHLYTVALPGSRDHDELGLLYAERGLQLSRKAKDEELVLDFATLAAMGLNDLGESRRALERAEEVLKKRPKDGEAGYERALALFELCRFKDAKQAFTALLSDPERSAHAHQHLGLLLEREGKLEEAQTHFDLAVKAKPDDFPAPIVLSKEAFARAVQAAVAELPHDMQADLKGVPVAAEDLPADEDLLGNDPPLSPTILGLFRGPPLNEPCDPSEMGDRPCRSVALYRLNLGRTVASEKELLEQIRVTLLHEVGHLRGEDDLELAARGLE